MQAIKFKKESNQVLYIDYIEQCRKALSILTREDQEDCLMEINSFIYEHIQAHQNEAEEHALGTILSRLGDPKDFLNDVIAAKKIDEVVKTYNVKSFFQAIYLNLKNGTIYVFLGLLSLLLLCFPILIFMELIDPENTGLYIGKNQFFFGVSSPGSEVKELLGSLFIPVAIIISTLLYFLIILILKNKSKNHNSKLLLS
jgi:uncharacterized membrane protein